MISKESDHGSRNSEVEFDIIVVGAGPVGLLTALNLGKAGVRTLVLEAHHELLPTTRAVVYMPVILPALRDLGILDLVISHAFLNTEGVRWRSMSGEVLAHLPLGSEDPADFSGVLLLGQQKMNELIMQELKKCPSVTVVFGRRCVGLEDHPQSERVSIMTHTGSIVDDEAFYSAKYILATDGANSAVRRMSCIPFEGFTYQDFKMIGSDVLYDFATQEGFTPLNFVVDEKDWAVIVYTGHDERGASSGPARPLWRVAYPEDPDFPISKEGYLERANRQVKKYISKGDGEFELIRAEPYLMQQRVAKQARKGRILLAGDALHSNNPIGGLGLTGGLLDAFCFGNALKRVLVGGESDDLLTTCADSRRNAWVEVTNKLSQDNLHRLYSTEPEVAAGREGFFKKLNDPVGRPAFAKMVQSSFNKMMPDDFARTASHPANAT